MRKLTPQRIALPSPSISSQSSATAPVPPKISNAGLTGSHVGASVDTTDRSSYNRRLLRVASTGMLTEPTAHAERMSIVEDLIGESGAFIGSMHVAIQQLEEFFPAPSPSLITHTATEHPPIMVPTLPVLEHSASGVCYGV